jgi:hypothetical protein
MSSSTRRQEQERDEYSISGQQPQQHEAAIRSIDETKEGIRRSIEELRREMPRYSQTITNFQNETADATVEIANNFLESQKEIIRSLQPAWAQMVERRGEEEGKGQYWTTSGMMMGMLLSPREMTDIYARTIGIMTETYMASTHMATRLIFAGMEAARATTNYVRQNAKETARITSNTARTFAQTAAAKETVQVEGEQSGNSASSSSSFSGAPEAATNTTTTATTFTNEAAAASSSRTGATTAETGGARIDNITAAGSTEKTRKR